MDCYSGTSEFIESLDFLSPPVKRISSSRQAFGSGYTTNANDVHLLRGFDNNIIRRAPCLTGDSKAVKHSESSTSLILKKTSEGQILGQQYSFVSFPSLHQTQNNNSSLLKSKKKPNVSNKPLIKVTVIPKTDSVQAAKLFRRQRHVPTKVQSTSSNHENSIQTKNVFLIIAGRRKEKIYEIKTTGSAKLSSDHDSYSKHEDIPKVELANFKHLIKSLNMDKKKKKEKRATVDTSEVQQSKEWNLFPEYNNCVCVREEQEVPKKSCVRIFGQFGISEDDKYVLRYGATVNDKQVMSDVAQLARDFSPIIADTSYGTTEEPPVLQQDSSLQADCNFDLDEEKPTAMDIVSKESQGTQVNFNVQVNSAQARCASFSDKRTQCSCCGNRSESNTLKDCQSPMVIISVYPKPSPDDLMNAICPNVITRSPSPVETYTSNQVLKTEKAPTKSETRRNNKSPLRSRSSSPAKKVSRPKVSDHSNKSQANEKKSPDRQKALKAIKEKIREKDKLKQDPSPRKLLVKTNTTNATQVSKNLQNVTVSNATQVSKRNQRVNTRSQATQASEKKYQPNNTVNATQVSAKRIKNYTATNGTQYSNESNATQCDDSFGSRHNIAPIKHSIDETTVPKKNSQRKSSPVKPGRTQVSNATQVPKVLSLNHATQVSRSDPLMNSCATQVTNPHPNVAPRKGKNQETFVPKPPQGFKSEQTSRHISKPKAESGTNTEQARAKKALVETYTKKLTEQMYHSDYIPARYDNSKVTINIDGDREHYNVLFNQDQLTTDLTIRKTIKEMGVPNIINESSLGSLLGLPDYTERDGYMSGNISPMRCPSPVLSNNPSDDDLPLIKQGSRLTIHDIRDSLEICHRREGDKSISNVKNTQTYFKTQFDEDTKFSAPMKHFPGDDCSIVDPIERDKQIRELLGVDNVKTNASKPCQGRSCDKDVENPFKCIYRRRCKKSQVTEINYGFHKLCPCFDPKHTTTASVQCQHANCKAHLQKQKNTGEKSTGESAVYQQLILNRNIQVFLQLEQFSKQKPIILSREQYDKVKKTIQKAINTKKSSHVKRNTLLSRIDSSEISIGEVRTKVKSADGSPQEKAKDQTPKAIHECKCNQTAVQTDPLCCKADCGNFGKSEEKWGCRVLKADVYNMKGDHSTDDRSDKLKKGKTEAPELQNNQLRPVIDEQRDSGVSKRKVDPCNQNKVVARAIKTNKQQINSECCGCNDVEVKHSDIETFVLYNADSKKFNFEDATDTERVAHTRKTMSSVQIRYASVAFMKQAAYSSTDVGAISESSIDHLNSFQTLFKGRRKSATPNLGTSAYSLYSEDGKNLENKCAKLDPQDSKPKKPFLRRLMSCLVMRSTLTTRGSELKLPVGPPRKLPSLNSSIDSYHISTSLGAVEVSSSIYDTSASFYSNHTIFPINSKIKRGFFSSVRGFLTNRKS